MSFNKSQSHIGMPTLLSFGCAIETIFVYSLVTDEQLCPIGGDHYCKHCIRRCTTSYNDCVKQYKYNVKFAYILRNWFALACDFSSTNRLLLILFYDTTVLIDRCGHHLSVDGTVALILVISTI